MLRISKQDKFKDLVVGIINKKQGKNIKQKEKIKQVEIL
jgi:hypothetical protein